MRAAFHSIDWIQGETIEKKGKDEEVSMEFGMHKSRQKERVKIHSHLVSPKMRV